MRKEQSPQTPEIQQPNLLENPGAFYDRAMKVVETPKEKQAEEKYKLFDWLKTQLKAAEEKLAPIEWTNYGQYKEMTLPNGISLSKSSNNEDEDCDVTIRKSAGRESWEVEFEVSYWDNRNILSVYFSDETTLEKGEHEKTVYVDFATNDVNISDATRFRF